jgi:hypothetical protein
MRTDRRLLALVLVLGLAPAAAAQPPPAPGIEVRLIPPERLTVGDRAEVVAEVHIAPHNEGPILITPVSEGAPVEVVRGRFSRPDAEDPTATPLRFRIPIVAQSPGTAVLRVHALGYACGGPARRCRALESSTSVVLRVVEPR